VTVLPIPDLDDRRFQDLVDDAKRLVQRRCETWTDHNVSDPGVTLIEAFAQMVDQLIYRLNRVPDRHYVKFLELVGIELRPPAAARGEVTFWLSAPQPQPVRVRAGTEVATARTDIHDPVVLATLGDLEILSCSLAHVAVQPREGEVTDTTSALGVGGGFPCFSGTPRAGDALLVGLSGAVPSCAVRLRLDCAVAGVGVDPRRPPLVWEAWTEAGWTACEVGLDGTGGLNRPGDIVVHVPATHRASVVARQRAGWLRCRLVEPDADQPTYQASPRIRDAMAFTVGGTAPVMHAELVCDEVLGRSDGTPGQAFPLQRGPVVGSEEGGTLQVDHDGTVELWQQVPHFAASGPDDKHFRLDALTGEVHLGPAVREADGSLRRYGAIPPRGATLSMTAYRTGGGRRGNVARGQVRLLKTSVPYVGWVENRSPAIGGADAETLDDAKKRAPLLLRSRGRAVTAEDFEGLAREVAPELARVECVPAKGPDEAGGVRLLVVPHVAGDDLGRVRRADLEPPQAVLERIHASLDARRLVGTRLAVVPPRYESLRVVARVSSRPGFSPDDVRIGVLRSLYRFFHPLHGGPDGTGWPFGRTVQAHEVSTALAQVPGVDMAQKVEVLLFPLPAGSKQTVTPRSTVELGPNSLVYSDDHQARVDR
jgi:predicted phage baseplate assembly protein